MADGFDACECIMAVFYMVCDIDLNFKFMSKRLALVILFLVVILRL